MVGFSKDAIITVDDWVNVERYNACLERLLARRKRVVDVTGPLFESKTAWKCAVLQQSLLYRTTALASGVAAAWNARNVISAVLCARALVETVAVCAHVGDELKRLIGSRDADAIDDLANKHLFATRYEKAVSEGYGYLATNILTYVDRFDKKIPGAREAYDFLSEWVHPNSGGHFLTFGELDKITGRVTFYETAPRVFDIEGHVTTCFMLILFMESVLEAFEETISVLAEIDSGQGAWISAPGVWPKSGAT